MTSRTRVPICPVDVAARFTRVYRDHYKFVRGVIHRCGVPLADVDDAVQEVFLVLHRRLEELDAGTAVRFWLRSVALGVCRNQRRKLVSQSRKGPGTEPINPDTLYDVVSRPPDEARALSEVRQVLARAVARLDTKKQDVFLLTALEERSAREIAELMRTSPNTVSSRLRAARKGLAGAVRALADE